ncbi:MAG TPA: acyl carrier protein [Dongiaceae bacterium]|jgi:acyl carrier protein|nr:acyl carrier protein [Dongiaceae bacterium]
MLRQIFARVLGEPLERITEDISTLTLLSWDSIRHVELVITLEEAYNTTFTTEEIIAMTSFQGICQVLRKKGVSIEY